ncbi:LacI family DNA-binding transcriptional regulator [Actinoplanes sp. NPDC051494]|uniref:LacI family DNA-binding transcriptional regulator n=1 Tax=Actinoplanes sp. NPDC051494 TaxID=3363907 RepID=UPI0037AB8F2F
MTDPRRVRTRPTMDEVAAAAGVSRGTVSRVLNGGHNVSRDALDAVERAIRRTGYSPNPHARSLVTQRSGSVAFILNEAQDRLFEDPTFHYLLRGCTQALAAHDITLVLTVVESEDDRQRVRRWISAGHVDGALLVSGHQGSPLLGDLLTQQVPVVVSGRPLGHERQVSYAAVDDRDGARQVATHLRAQGRRRIAIITGPQDTSGGVDRLAGFTDVLGTPDPLLVATGDYTEASGEMAMATLLHRAPDLDAVFACSDVMAAGAMTTLHRAGRTIPDDVAVAGFDDAKLAAGSRPPLTTVRQPWHRLSAEMVRLLLARIDGDGPSAVILPADLVTRQST